MAWPGNELEVVSVCAIELPLPELPPETPVCETVQLKTVPAILDNAIAVEFPEQIVREFGVATAIGVTGCAFNVIVVGSEMHPAAVFAVTVCEVPAVSPL